MNTMQATPQPSHASTFVLWFQRALLLFVLGAPLIPATGLTQGAPPGKRIALVIGNDAYKGNRGGREDEWPVLKNAGNDARAIAARLRQMGFTDVQDLYNLTRRQTFEALEAFSKRVQSADQAVFYYSGHGVQLRERNYLIPVDAPLSLRESHLKADAIPFEEILAHVSAGNGEKVVILDACRTLPQGFKGSTASGFASPEAQGRLPPQTLVVFASQHNETASDGPGRSNGLFALGMLKGLSLPDPTLFNVVAQAEEEVLRLSDQQQRPVMYGSPLAQRAFRFGAASASAPSAADALLAQQQREIDDLRRQLAGRSTSPAPLAKANESAMTLSNLPRVLPRDCDVCPIMVALPAGNYTRGASDPEQIPLLAAGLSIVDFTDARPAKRVTIARPFAIGQYEVTQSEWEAVMGIGKNPSHFKACGPQCPVENVSFDDIQTYIRLLNERTGNRFGYRLPSETQWEYAARAGTTTPFHTGRTITSAQANFNGSKTYNGSATGKNLETTTKVGSYPPNEWGLHDMLGNVWEWTQDCYESDYSKSPIDGSAWEPDAACRRVLRGGSWYTGPWNLRVAYRNGVTSGNRNYGTGFRVVRNVF